MPTPGPSAGTRCPACGVGVPPGFKFCGACGAPVGSRAPSPAAPTGPRRPILARGRVSLLAQDGSVVSTWPLTGEEISVGTTGEVRLTDAHAAPAQGRFLVGAGGIVFRPERGASNGAFLLLKKELELPVGAELRVGRQLLRLERHAARPPPPSPVWGSPDPGYRFRMVQLLAGDVEGDAFPLREGENLIGRTAGDLSFPGDGYVSSRHALLTVRGDRVFVKDLGSSNGSFVRIANEAAVETGDLILVGEQLLRLDP